MQEKKYLDNLPEEILLHLLSYLDKRDLLSMSLVSWRFNSLSFDSSLWNNLTLASTISIDKATKISRKFKYVKSINLSNSNQIHGFTENCSNITNISLPFCEKLKPCIMETIVKAWPKLR